MSNGHAANGEAGWKPEPFRIFVGYDLREDLAYKVCRHSILKHTTIPVEITPIRQSDLWAAGLYRRDRGPTESTEFSFTRFLTPYLTGYRGWALFIDCDFLYTADIAPLAALCDDRYAIMCVKHDYTPTAGTKMDGVVQTVYPEELVIHGAVQLRAPQERRSTHCRRSERAGLTVDAVSERTGAFLHRFMWLDDEEIGEVSCVWNFLVGHNKVDEGDLEGTFPRAIHYTQGGPWFEGYKDCEFTDLWFKELEELQAKERKSKASQVVQEENTVVNNGN